MKFILSLLITACICLTPAVKALADGQAEKAAGQPVQDSRNQALFNQFKSALEVYHRGRSSGGSGAEIIQLPPGLSKDQLPSFIDKLSSFLSCQPGIDVKLPPPGQTEAEFRAGIDLQSAEAVREHRQLYLSTAVEKIVNPVIRRMVQDALAQAPPEFFTAAASSSGKNHPADEINTGGLSLHTLRAILLAEKLILFYNGEAGLNVVGNQKITADQKDVILGGLLLHDIQKGGTPWKNYDQAHGPLGEAFLKQVWKNNPDQDLAGKMAELAGNHMAQWNKAPGNVPDPRPPQDITNQIASYADYLASLKAVYVRPFPDREH